MLDYRGVDVENKTYFSLSCRHSYLKSAQHVGRSAAEDSTGACHHRMSLFNWLGGISKAKMANGLSLCVGDVWQLPNDIAFSKLDTIPKICNIIKSIQ